jgi:aspartate aminotransferase-like enzyme
MKDHSQGGAGDRTGREPFTTDRLFCPGPTPVPSAAVQAGTATSVYHRTDEFYKAFQATAAMLAPFFGAKNAPIILAASGTGGLEAAVQNLTAAGDEVVVVNGGKFGERWEKLASAYQLKAEVVKLEWGTVPTAAQLLDALGRCRAPKALFIQANETSTGVYYPVEALVKAVRAKFSGFIVVDCISSLGAHAMRMDDWGVDCVVAGSQKGFGIPPGLAFVALSDKAWSNLSARPRFYFDLARERKSQLEGQTAWTPATTLILSLKKALEMLHETGLDRVTAHHQQLADATRAAVAAMGLTLFATSNPSNALTAVNVPAGMDGSKLVKSLRSRFGMIFAGGQDHLKGKIVRIAHLGFVSRFDLIDGLAAFEWALAEAGHRFDLGQGVKIAMQKLTAS